MCWLQGSRSRSSKRMKQAAIEAAPDRAITKCYSRAPRYYAESNATHKSAGRTFDAPALHNRALHIMQSIFSPAARRRCTPSTSECWPPRRWAKNALHSTQTLLEIAATHLMLRRLLPT